MPGLDETDNSFRVRQKDPGSFDDASFRTISIGSGGVKAVVGCPSGKYEGGKCSVGMQVQTYIFPKDKFKTKDDVRQWIRKNSAREVAEVKAAADILDMLDESDLDDSLDRTEDGGDTMIMSAEAKEQTTKEREKLEDEQFAYPEERKLPINDAAHVRNALARWNQTDIPADKKSAVLGRICRAAKKFGIESDLCKEKGKAEAMKLETPDHEFNPGDESAPHEKTEDELKQQLQASAGPKPAFISVPAFETKYVATPLSGEAGELDIRAITLEEGDNVNGWSVDREEFPRVAAAYGMGRQLRINHSKDMQHVIGKSYESVVLTGAEIPEFMGAVIDGINPEGLYVGTKFRAEPKDPQVRTNILNHYVETGSIGLDANAFCAECGKPLVMNADEKLDRTCTHYDAKIRLRNVDVKEYSYVAEPAFSHSIARPSLAAAISVVASRIVPHAGSSLSQTRSSETSKTLSESDKAKASLQASAEGKKAEADGKAEGKAEGEGRMYSESEANALAEQRLADYKKGYADAAKFRAKDGEEPDSDDKQQQQADAEGKKAEADAGAGSRDQIGRAGAVQAPPAISRDELMARILTPMAAAAKSEPWVKEVFQAAAAHPKAPNEVRAAVKATFGLKNFSAAAQGASD